MPTPGVHIETVHNPVRYSRAPFPNGLGTKEAAVDLLYRTVPYSQQIARGIGTMVALGTLLVLVGALFLLPGEGEN